LEVGHVIDMETSEELDYLEAPTAGWPWPENVMMCQRKERGRRRGRSGRRRRRRKRSI